MQGNTKAEIKAKAPEGTETVADKILKEQNKYP